MRSTDLDARQQAAIAIIREAGALARRYFDDPASMNLDFKGPQDYITAADGAVEKLIVQRLGEAFPGDGCLGEEGGGALAPRLWVIDPIDGTANFARGIPHFCISIALVSEGEIALGLLYNPVNDELHLARRGAGATLDGKPIKVSGASDLRTCSVELGWSPRRPMTDYLAVLDRLVAAGASFRRAGSGALGLAMVADGRQDGYAELHINSWDALAGILLVQEAGGWVNDFLAGDALLQGNPVLACSPALRAALSKVTGIE